MRMVLNQILKTHNTNKVNISYSMTQETNRMYQQILKI